MILHESFEEEFYNKSYQKPNAFSNSEKRKAKSIFNQEQRTNKMQRMQTSETGSTCDVENKMINNVLLIKSVNTCYFYVHLFRMLHNDWFSKAIPKSKVLVAICTYLVKGVNYQ